MLASTLHERDRCTLRALPSNSSGFFGPEATALFLAREKEKQQDSSVRMVMVVPKSSGPKRKSFGRQTGSQAKKHKQASASQPPQSQPQATPRPSSFYSKKKGLLRSQGRTASIGQHRQCLRPDPLPSTPVMAVGCRIISFVGAWRERVSNPWLLVEVESGYRVEVRPVFTVDCSWSKSDQAGGVLSSTYDF